MKMNEVAGIGNWNTAEFWEYSTRTARRMNLDPVKTANISPFSTFASNPIIYSDINGDDINANEETGKEIVKGIDNTLDGKPNPVGYDKDKQQLTYDDNVDISELSDAQKTVVQRYERLIKDPNHIVNVELVDENQKLPELQNKDLISINAAGITQTKTYNTLKSENPNAMKGAESIVGSETYVYIARNPTRNLDHTMTWSDGKSLHREGRESYPKGYSGYVGHHEIIGHAYENAYTPIYYTNEPGANGIMQRTIRDINNMKVEMLDKLIRGIFKLDNGDRIDDESLPDKHPRQEGSIFGK